MGEEGWRGEKERGGNGKERVEEKGRREGEVCRRGMDKGKGKGERKRKT